MTIRAALPKKSASLIILRPTPPSLPSLYDYQVLILQRKQKLSFGLGLVFPGGALQPRLDQPFQKIHKLSSTLQSTALRQCFQQTGLYFFKDPLLHHDTLAKLNTIRLKYIADVFNNIPDSKQTCYSSLSQLLPPTPNLIPFIRLITIPQLKRRYDTTFYLLSTQPYKYINFQKYAQHEKHLHQLDHLIHSDQQFNNSRWMNPAQLLNWHFQKKALIHPPQYIMLNIMMKFRKREGLVQALKMYAGSKSNLNMGPNIVSLIANKDRSVDRFPYAAALLGDHQFPYQRIINNQQLPQLRQQMAQWQKWQSKTFDSSARNRFLFPQSSRFFQKKYELSCNVPNSLVTQMQDWDSTHLNIAETVLPQTKI